MTEAEVSRLFAATTGRARLVWRLLVLTGARIGELIALRRDDIHGNVLRIDESAVNRRASTTKNKKTRMAPLPPALARELAEWVEQMPADQVLLFPAADGRLVRRQRMNQEMLQAARDAAGIPDLTFRMCRTTFATLYHGDIADAQAILGHTTADFTLREYKRSVSERAAAGVAEMENRLGGVVRMKKRA